MMQFRRGGSLSYLFLPYQYQLYGVGYDTPLGEANVLVR